MSIGTHPDRSSGATKATTMNGRNGTKPADGDGGGNKSVSHSNDKQHNNNDTATWTSSGEVVVVADYSGGVSRQAPVIVTGLIFLTTVYVTLVKVMGSPERPIIGRHFPLPDAAYCNDNDTRDPKVPCVRADLFAFQMSSGVAIIFCGTVGVWTWYISRRVHTALPATPEARLLGYLPEAELLAAMNFTFQLWDFFISLLIPEHCTAIMLSHHLAAATVSWCSIQFQYLHYYGIFFLGLTEVSSLPLVFVHLAKFFPPVPGSLYDKCIAILCGPAFVVTFVLYRFIYWWPISWQLFRDVRTVVASGRAEALRPGKTWVLYIFLCLNVPLGLLQLYWLTIIFDEAKKVLQANFGFAAIVE